MRQHVRMTVAAAALALVTAGCGSGSEPTDALAPAETVRSAVSTTTAEQSSRMSMDVLTDASGMKVDIKAEGLFDFANKVGTMSMTLPGTQEKVEMILDGDTMYMKVPGQGSSYYSLPVKEIAGTSFGSTSDPTSSLQVLTGMSDDVTEVGEAEVRGEKTTHYTGTYDLQRAVDKATGTQKQSLQKMLDVTGTAAIPFDAYIDHEGRLRKMVQKITAKVPTAPAQELRSTITMELYDFGVPVHVTAPTDVKDGSALVNSFKTQLGGSG